MGCEEERLKSKEVEERQSPVDEAQIEEFCRVVARIIVRALTSHSGERDNCSTIDVKEIDEQ